MRRATAKTKSPLSGSRSSVRLKSKRGLRKLRDRLRKKRLDSLPRRRPASRLKRKLRHNLNQSFASTQSAMRRRHS